MSKLENIKNIIKELNEEDIFFLEKLDRQYKSLENLYAKIKDKKLFFKLILINALMSYQLQMKGEDYWEKFSTYFSDNKKIENFKNFITLYNKRFLRSKLKRLEKVIFCIENLFKTYSIEDLGNNLENLVNFLSNCLKQDKEAKTIVFAAKMFMYGYKIAYGKYPKGTKNIFIPLDSRLKKLEPNKKVWENFLREVQIDPIKLDVLLWLPQNLKDKDLLKLPLNLREKINILKKILSS